MKKKVLFLVITASIILSSMITGSASALANSDIATDGLDFKIIFRCFTESNAAIVSAIIVAVLFLMLVIFGKKIKGKLDNSTASQLTNAFILFFSISGIACLAMAFATDGITWSNLMHKNPDSEAVATQFEDYILGLKSAGSQKFYKTAATTTPFAHLILFLLAQFVPANYIFTDSAISYVFILRNQTFMYLYLILVMLCVVLLYRMNRHVLRNNSLNMRDEVVAFLFAVSYPAVYCIEKGNLVGFSIVLVMVFVLLRNTEKNLFKELSLVALAAAAAISPYTLIFALLLFDEKSKKAVMRFVRTVLYFLIMFIMPAVFTGFGNLLTYTKAFVSVSAEGFTPGNMSIANLLHFFGISNSVVIYAVVILTELIAVLAMFILPEMWQKTAAAAYIILNIYSVSDATLAMFIFIPLIFLLAQKKHRASSWVYMLTFALLITPMPEWFIGDINRFTMFMESMGIVGIQNANNLISLAAAQFIVVMLLYQMITVMRANKLKKQSAVTEQIEENKDNGDIIQ